MDGQPHGEPVKYQSSQDRSRSFVSPGESGINPSLAVSAVSKRRPSREMSLRVRIPGARTTSRSRTPSETACTARTAYVNGSGEMLASKFRVWLQDPDIPPVWTGVKLVDRPLYVKAGCIEVTVEGNGSDLRRLI